MKERQKFLKIGLIKKKNFLSLKDKQLIRSNFKSILSNFTSCKFVSFEDNNLHKSLIKIRKNNPKKFGDFYDMLNLSSGIKQLFFQDKFLKLFSKTLNIDIYKVYINGFMFRLDVPNDTRNSLDWHQDSPYYEMNYPEFNSGVCWISITANNFNNGSLQYIPRSHKNGMVKAKSSKYKKLNSQQFKINVKKVSKVETLESLFGDVSIFHMNIKHRSGLNISSKIRMTIGCRFHEFNKKFNIGKEVYIFNKSKKTTLF